MNSCHKHRKLTIIHWIELAAETEISISELPGDGIHVCRENITDSNKNQGSIIEILWW